MKRPRRLFTPFRWNIMRGNAYWGSIIPPLSIVKAATQRAREDYGPTELRIGYYGKTDCLNCVSLVNEEADYFATADQKYMKENFEVIHRSNEIDLYGDDRPVLEPLLSAAK